MDQLVTYIILFSIIVVLGQLFQKSTMPISLILVIFGMLASYFPFVPEINLDPNLVLDFFLPILIYQISAFSSWRDVKKQLRPIALLSIGHVIFITILVAVVIHALIPQIGWPLAFVLGAVISPPDDVAIVSLCEKFPLPQRVFIILEGEGMFNDVAALTFFRFALAALITHQFSIVQSFVMFLLMMVGETVYGFLLGHLLGKIREKITNPFLHIIASILTPFLAYLPVVKLGGSGVLATAVVGFLIGNYYALRFTSEFRLISRGIWPAIAFAIQGLIFLLVGLDMRSILLRISAISLETLMLYVISIVLVVIVGRFIWVYGAVAFLPRFLFPSIRKKDPYPPWQFPFIISWAGVRGGISLAAAFAVPSFAVFKVNGVDPRDLIIFLVFCIIAVTFVLQGFSLPVILRKIGVDKVGQRERYNEHMAELHAATKMYQAALLWLKKSKAENKNNKKLLDQINLYINENQVLEKQNKERIAKHDDQSLMQHDEVTERIDDIALLYQIIDVKRTELLRLWREDKINLTTRNKLLSKLDYQVQHLIT